MVSNGCVLFANLWIRVDCIVSVYRHTDLRGIQVSWCAYSDDSDHCAENAMEQDVKSADASRLPEQDPVCTAEAAHEVPPVEEPPAWTGHVHTVDWRVDASVITLVERVMRELVARIGPVVVVVATEAMIQDAATRPLPTRLPSHRVISANCDFVQCGDHLVFRVHTLASITRHDQVITVDLAHAPESPLSTFHWSLESVREAQHAMQALLCALQAAASTTTNPEHTPICVLYAHHHLSSSTKVN
jgi:hypothetical protein